MVTSISQKTRNYLEQTPGLSFFWALLRELRPRQWIKNFALFAGLIFSGLLDSSGAIQKIFHAFLIFCAASSATYLLNDVFDIERDRLHPFKSKRPIDAGIIPAWLAVILSLGI